MTETPTAPATTETPAPARTRSNKAYLTTGQVAKVCKVAPRTVSKWFDSGRLKGHRIPGSEDRRIAREDLAAFLRENNMPATMLAEVEGPGTVLYVAAPLSPEPPGGWLVRRAFSGFDAAVAVNAGPVAAAVIDFAHLGRTAAVDLAGHLRKAGVPCVGLACEDELDAIGLLEHGFAAVVMPPHTPAAVADALAKATTR